MPLLFTYKKNKFFHYIALVERNPDIDVCQPTKHRPACASEQSDQRLCYSVSGMYYNSTCYNQISIFYLFSVAEQTGLSLTSLETRKTGYLATRPMYQWLSQMFIQK